MVECILMKEIIKIELFVNSFLEIYSKLIDFLRRNLLNIKVILVFPVLFKFPVGSLWILTHNRVLHRFVVINK